MDIFVCYSESTYVIEDTSVPGDPYSGFVESQCDWMLTGATTKQPKDPYFTCVKIDATKKPKKIFVVYVRYRDGGTFSSTSGMGHIVAAYPTRKDADSLVKAVNSNMYTGHAPWSGYFARLEHIDVEELSLN